MNSDRLLGPFVSYDIAFFVTHYRFSLLLTSFTCLLLATLVLAKNRRGAVNHAFIGVMLAIAGWSGLQALIGTWPNSNHWLRIAQVEHLIHVFIPSLFLQFSHAALRIGWTRGLKWSYAISGAFFMTVLTPWFFRGVVPDDYAKFALIVGPLYWAYFVWFSITMIIALLKLKGGIRHAADPLERTKLKYMLWAMVIGYSGGYPNFFYVFDIDLYPLMPFSTYFVPLYPLIVTYAILRHRALDIPIVIRKSLVYSVLAAVITGAYFSVVFIAERSLQGVMGYRSIIGSLIAGFVITLGFNPLRELIQRIIDRWLFHSSRGSLVEENERLRQEVARTERLKSVATLAAGMAHEIKNPLAAIKTFAEYLPEKFEDTNYREKYARIMGQEIERMNSLVKRLLEFARPSEPRLQPVEVSSIVKDTLEFLHGTIVERQIRVETALNPTAQVMADPSQLKQVFLNLILNSIDAIKSPGQILVSSHRENGHVHVTITDSGCGIPRGDLPRIFDPFFSRKTDGTGLGLSVVHSIIQEHGGRIAVDSELGEGTTIRISLPTAGEG